MQAAVIYFAENESDKLAQCAQGLKEGIEKQGITVELINGRKESGKRLTAYSYLAIGADSSSFFGGKVGSEVKTFLKQAGTLSGKRCFAFTSSKGLRNGATLQSLMRIMEAEALYLKYSDVLQNQETAKAVGKKLHIQ